VSSLYDRLPPLRTLNRSLLLAIITFVIWNFDLAWDLLVAVILTPPRPHPWEMAVAPRILRYLFLLPLMVSCYLLSLRMRRWVSTHWMAWAGMVVLGFGYSALVHPLLFVAHYLISGDINSDGRIHYANLLEASINSATLSYVLANLIIYLLGLFIILGVSARLDLENERIRTEELHTRWLNARLDTLRGQLNPHFLFNSLHTISSLLFTDVKRADKLLADLSDVLRTTLREGQRDFSTVREEMDYARRYLSIEETRFEDRLSIVFEVDGGCLGARVPTLILQPLVENAIKHGMGSSSGANRLTVSARRDGDELLLEVGNDFRPDDRKVPAERKMGIGLSNVRERLAAVYGGDFVLSSQASADQRWVSRICMPFEPVSDEPRVPRSARERAA